MSRTFTIYNCGTCFNRERTDEVIANLASRTDGSENREWMINDGVGSKPKSAHSLAHTPGLCDPVTGFKTSTPPMARLQGVVNGYGWDQNVAHALAVVKALIAGSNSPPSVINLCGWSRGAITCHMMAHALAKDVVTQNLPVNVFAFDPVPGPNNSDLEKISLPANVRDYSAVVMEDEARKIMKPVVFDSGSDENSGKQFKIYPLPGAHETSVFALKSEVGTIAAALAHKFLTKHGTRLRDPILLNDCQFCELYAKVRIDIDKYRRKKGNRLQRLLLGSQGRNIHNDLRDTAYFINPHHAQKFSKVFPGMWRMMNLGAESDAEVEAESKLVRAIAPTTYESLVAAGII